MKLNRYRNNGTTFHARVLLLAVVLNVVILAGAGQAQDPNSAARFGVGAEFGVWRPNDLSDDITLSFLKQSKDHPYIGFVILKPWRYGLTLRTSPGYWKYADDKIPGETQTIEILSCLVDLKYELLSDVRLLPYVSYGIGWFLGREKEEGECHFKFGDASDVGLGVNVGTGFDFKLATKIYTSLEFRYHYIKFNKVIAFTNNYSGAKVSLALYYLF